MKRGSLSRTLKQFAGDPSGNMLILSALAMPVIIGFAGLAVEYGSAVALRAENQRISDLAAYAGAVAYSHEKSESRMRAAAPASDSHPIGPRDNRASPLRSC